jgi:hypothetical protein
LRATPYSLEWGSSVYAKVIATNTYGNSIESLAGNDAMITTNPDAPINIIEDTVWRTKTSLSFTWDSPVFTGGDVIIDYGVNFLEVNGFYMVAASGVSSTSYTVTGLTAGKTYEFKVIARNSYGYGSYSTILTVLAGSAPSTPVAPTTTISGSNVIISWTKPSENGASITAYTITIR